MLVPYATFKDQKLARSAAPSTTACPTRQKRTFFSSALSLSKKPPNEASNLLRTFRRVIKVPTDNKQALPCIWFAACMLEKCRVAKKLALKSPKFFDSVFFSFKVTAAIQDDRSTCVKNGFRLPLDLLTQWLIEIVIYIISLSTWQSKKVSSSHSCHFKVTWPNSFV